MKQVKLFFALLLSLVMVMSLAACGDDNGGGDADAEETVKIGVITYDTTDDQTKNFMAYYESLGEELGVEFMISESLADAEGELNFIADCASAGCIGIVGYYNESLEEAALAAADYGMYYWGGFGGNEEAYDAVKANEYYVGGYTLGDAEYNAGYEWEKLCKQGCTKIVYNNGGADFGVAMFVDRQQDFYMPWQKRT
jgi:ABC-type sugar transport system substrate-binding protein